MVGVKVRVIFAGSGSDRHLFLWDCPVCFDEEETAKMGVFYFPDQLVYQSVSYFYFADGSVDWIDQQPPLWIRLRSDVVYCSQKESMGSLQIQYRQYLH